MSDILPSPSPLTARLRNVARNDGTTVEQMASLPDYELKRIPNLGPKAIEFLRQFYPQQAPFSVRRFGWDVGIVWFDLGKRCAAVISENDARQLMRDLKAVLDDLETRQSLG
jgi:hypothetical protein